MTSLRTTDLGALRGPARRRSWRLAAIALFTGLPLGAAALTMLAVVTRFDAAERADHADETARAIVHQLDRKSGAAKPFDDAQLYLGSANANLAQAELQALVASRIEAAGGRLIQLQPLEATEQDPPGRVAAEITFDIGNAGLLDMLYATEAGLPILDVPRLDARVQAAADPASAPADLLRITMTVAGSWKVPAP